MSRVGLSAQMIGRLSMVAVAVCVPVAINAVVMNTPPQRAAVMNVVADKIAGNPYGTISPMITFAHREQAVNPSEVTQILRSKSKGTSFVPQKMMIGCDALGGVSSKLAHVAGKCLT